MMSKIFNGILLNLDLNKRLECVAMYNEKVFVNVSYDEHTPDNIIGIKDLFYKYPGSLSSQIIMEGKLKSGRLTKSSIGEISCYLRVQLLENEASKSLGMLYNEKYCQFFMIKKSNPRHLYQSKLYELDSMEAMKLFYYFTVNLALDDEFSRKFEGAPQWYHKNNISILGIVGKGGSSVVYGVNVFEQNNNNTNDNSVIKSRAALKICSRQRFHETTGNIFVLFSDDEDLYDSICEKEEKFFKKMGEIKEEMKVNNDKRHFPGIEATKYTFGPNNRICGYLMPLLEPIGSEKEMHAIEICEALKLFHENGLFHCDLFWRNIMNDRIKGRLYIIDYQCMQESKIDSQNEDTFQLLAEDLMQLYKLYNKDVGKEQYQVWQNKYKKNEWESIYDDFLPFARELNA